MNDPNGLVYYAGEYHLFYQYHPHSSVWGPMHWGHAVSHDLQQWQHLPIALYPDALGAIFSGCGLVDWHNTAGFGREAMVLVFTHHQAGRQRQSLAYSLDRGRTWHKYAGNPVLEAPPAVQDFRDPKVFWYGGQAGYWVMALASGRDILFYTSPNLRQWQASGRFGGGYGATGGTWETPDLFELPVDGRPERHWLLTVGLDKGGLVGGSATQYFIGHFDGHTFTSHNPPQTILWADAGPDYYAPQSYSDEPSGRRIMIGWLNNWQYAAQTPTNGWRGLLSLPRQLTLATSEHGLCLRQKPVIRSNYPSQQWQRLTLPAGNLHWLAAKGDCLEIEVQIDTTTQSGILSFHLRAGQGEATIISYDIDQQQLSLDRTHSGQTAFNDQFAGRYTAHLPPIQGTIRLHIFLDRCSIELFGNDGLLTLSALIFPAPQNQAIGLLATNSVTIDNLRLTIYP